MQQPSYYEILGVAPDASAEGVRKAYLAIAMKISAGGKEPAEAQDEFFRTRHAFEVLSDPMRRSRYDATLWERHLQSLVEKASLDGADTFARIRQPVSAVRPIYTDPIQVALNIYHLPWGEFSTYPLSVRLRKLTVTAGFRLFYAVLGAILGLGIAILLAIPVQVERGYGVNPLVLVVYRNATIALALLFFVFGRVLFFKTLCRWFRFPKDP